MDRKAVFSLGKKSLIETLKLQAPMEMEYSVSYETEKDKRKFIERTKRSIRKSMEYKDYIRFLKDNMDMDRCSFFKNVQHTKDNKVKIEVHHEPFTLDDIVRIVINKQMDEGKPLNELDIADEVMELHYSDEIGLIPLSITVHEVIHSQESKITIPLTLCYGDYRKFVEDYQDYIEDDILTRLEYKIENTKNITQESFNALLTKYLYLDVDGVNAPSKIEVEVGDLVA